jgi:hypothetical protein
MPETGMQPAHASYRRDPSLETVMSRLLPTALAALSLTAVAGLAHAQTGGRGNLDADTDGSISAAEFEAGAQRRFQRMDGNGDGVVDAGELAALKARMADRPGAANRPDMLAEMDGDKDGRITQGEALAASKARFAKLDTNGDDALSDAEQAAMWSGRSGGAR